MSLSAVCKSARAARTALIAVLGSVVVAAGVGGASPAESIALHYHPLELPGAPAAIVPVDLDGDGVRDLAVAVAYTRWEEIGITEASEMDEVDGLVEVMTVVPALFDRRELWAFRGRPGGGWEPFGPPLPLGTEVLALLAGPPGMPLLALTDDGVSAVRLIGGASESVPAVRLEPAIADPPVFAGSGALIGELGLVHDLDGNGRSDLLLPADDGLAVYLAGEDGLRAWAASRVELPADATERQERLVRHYPLPKVEDVDGDGRPDLVTIDHRKGWERFWVAANRGGGRFAPAIELSAAPAARDGGAPEIVYFGDLDGDGVAEYARAEDLGEDDAGVRTEIREAKMPPFRWRLYRSGPSLAMTPAPYQSFRAVGYAEGGDEGEDGIRLPGGFRDLDGDGRSDLVTLTLDFSVLQAMRILATRSISIGLDFHVWCQRPDGGFAPVEGLDLSGKFRLRLDDLEIGRLPQLGGDFDGDGRADFVQLGRGRSVTVHLGRPGCRYPPRPDVTLRLAAEPKDLGLVRVTDLDGDGRSDLAIVQPQGGDPAATSPVRLDLYLSRVSRGDGR
jgi:hypothetical protein